MSTTISKSRPANKSLELKSGKLCRNISTGLVVRIVSVSNFGTVRYTPLADTKKLKAGQVYYIAESVFLSWYRAADNKAEAAGQYLLRNCRKDFVESFGSALSAGLGDNSADRIILHATKKRRFRSLSSALSALSALSEKAFLTWHGVTIARNTKPLTSKAARLENPPRRLSLHSARFFANIAERQLEKDPGGFSIRLVDQSAPRSGFLVSRLGSEKRLSGKPTEAALSAFILENPPRLIGDYFGGWKDTASGSFFLDWSVRFSDISEALYFARHNKQAAIYSASAGRSFYLSDFGKDQDGSTGLQSWSRGSCYPVSVSVKGGLPYVWNLKSGDIYAEFGPTDTSRAAFSAALSEAHQYAERITRAARGN